jgi:GNAT superfamily N-acetyltransferase
MNRRNLLVKYDKDLRLRLMYPGARKEITEDVVRLVREAPGMNLVSFTFANESKLHEVIHREVDYFAPLNQPFTWKVYDHDLLPNLKAELIAHGFQNENDSADVMVLSVKNVPATILQATQADIRRITNQTGLKDVIYVLDKVWGGDNTWVNDQLGMHLQVSGYLSVYAAYVDDQPAAVAWTYFPRGHFATLFAGSTVPEYRKQGLYTSLLATQLREIRERGYPFAVVEAGAMSKPIVAKYGFQRLTTVYDYEWKGN